MKKVKHAYPLIVTALILLFNPVVNVIDILPDCIAYILLILAIGAYTDTVPYLTECRSALVKLALVTLIKIPAFTVMYSNMSSGKDIVPLFTLVFVTLELILLYSAVTNGFGALSYLGERTDAGSVREPFKIRGKRSSTPEQLKILTLGCFLARGILNVAPEIMLLTPENASIRRRLTEAYPAVLVLCIFASLVIGLIWLSHALKFVKAVKSAGDLKEAIVTLEHRGTPDEESVKSMKKKLISALTLLAVSSVFIFDIVIEDFGGYNILPHFIYGILMLLSFRTLVNDTKIIRPLIAVTAGYAISSLLGHFFTQRFFESHTYVDLKYSASAKATYSSVKLLAVIELIFALLMLASAAVATVRFIKEHTDVSPSDPSYSKTNAMNHKLTARNVMPVFAISAIIHILKCANVFIKQTISVTYSEVNPEGIISSGAPYMDTVIFLACVVYVICCFVKTSNLKDEVKFKYDKE